MSLVKIKQYKKALKYLHKFYEYISYSEKYTTIKYYKALCLYKLKNYNEALNHCNIILKDISNKDENSNKVIKLKIRTLKQLKRTTDTDLLQHLSQEFKELKLWDDSLDCAVRISNKIGNA